MFCGCRSHIYAFYALLLNETNKNIAIIFYEFFKNDPPTVEIVEKHFLIANHG